MCNPLILKKLSQLIIEKLICILGSKSFYIHPKLSFNIGKPKYFLGIEFAYS